MRNTFINTLMEEARKDSTITLIVGDLGFGVVDGFAEEMPDQFLNAGVAEQAMTGVAAGMASAGRRVFTYSIANFPTIRCLEQIRLDVCYHARDVTIISVGAGLAYGTLGYTHHAVEDLAVMRCLPGLKVVSPCDPVEAEAVARFASTQGGPLYVRLGKSGEPVLHAKPLESLIPGTSTVMRDGTDVTILATGAVLLQALEAAELLAERAIGARVISSPWVKPLDTLALQAAATETAGIVTVEDHSIVGGFGSAVLEALADAGLRTPVERVALPDLAMSGVGSSDYLLGVAGVTASGVAEKALKLLA